MDKYIAASAALIAGLLSITHADAQTARVVTTCGSTSPFPSPHTGSITSLYVDTNGDICGGGGGGGGGGTSSSFGSAFPTVGTASGFANAAGNMASAAVSVWGVSPTGLGVLGVNADILSSVLPTGAATAANQEVTTAGTSATSAQGVQGVHGGIPTTGAYISAGTGQFGTSINSSTALPSIPSNTLFAEICVETAAARYTDDGATTPTASVGIPVPAGSCWQVAGSSLLAAFRIIGTGATLDVSYYK